MQCCPFGCICGLSVRWNLLRASRGSMRGLLLRADVVSPVGGEAGDQSGCACRVSVRGARRCILPGSDVIELHEIHLARLSSLQVPVGHIAVPGGIKLCSPGTFLVANSLIINSGSCQVNFTKLNSATIRYTNFLRCSSRMPVRCLLVGLPCQSADRCPLRHATLPQKCFS